MMARPMRLSVPQKFVETARASSQRFPGMELAGPLRKAGARGGWYLFGVAIMALATWLRLLLDPLLGNEFPFGTMFLGVLVTVWYGGFGPALLAILWGALLTDYYLIEPRGAFALNGRTQYWGMGMHLATSLVIAVLGAAMRAARRRAEASARAGWSQAELIEQAYEAVLVWDWNGRITFGNRGAERLYGFDRAAVVTRDCHRLLGTRCVGSVLGFTGALSRDGFWEGELEQTTQSGQQITVESRMVLVRELDHTYVLETNRDITQRKLLAAEAQESRERLEALVHAAMDAIITVNVEQRIVLWNPAAEQMFHCPAEVALGQPLSRFIPVDARALHRNAVSASRAAEMSGPGAGSFDTLRGLRGGGEAFPIEASSFQVEVSGQQLYTVISRDITARVQADTALRRSEERLREAQKIAQLGTWEWDLRTGVVTRSAELCQIFGQTHEAFGRAETLTYDHIHPEDREKMRAELQEAVATQEGYDLSYRVLRPDGLRYVHSLGLVFRDETGKPVRTLGTVQDVTERKQVEVRLMLASRMASIGTLAAGMAHEINNPLAYVLLNLELVAEQILEISRDAPSGRMRELGTLVAEAREGGERVRKIVGDLKTFSRVDDACSALLDVRRVLEVAATMANNEIRHRARLVKELGEVPLVEGDEARLGQVFINLLVNAAQAIPEGGADANEIRVATRTDGAGRAVVEVRDTGPGMSHEVQARIFDPFFTTKPIGVGTGLGLSICHGIVTALGGEITVQSELGKGAMFQVVLPAARAVKLEATPRGAVECLASTSSPIAAARPPCRA
jgi:PAS domain S-box-containing protein